MKNAPAYVKVYSRLKNEINKGTYPVGGFLPKECELEKIYQALVCGKPVDNVENPLDTGGRAFLYTVSTLHSGLYKACQRTFVSAAPDVKNGGGFLGRPTIERNFKKC